MVQFWPLATAAAVCLATSTSVSAQNGVVHAPNILGATAPSPKPVATPVTPAIYVCGQACHCSSHERRCADQATDWRHHADQASTPTKPATGATSPKTPVTTAPKVTLTPPPTLAASATWVSNFKEKATQSSCYRRTALGKSHLCPPSYIFDGKLGCYPVQWGMECLPQNKDCMLNIRDRVSAVAATAVKTETGGFFGEFTTVAKGLTHGVSCA